VARPAVFMFSEQGGNNRLALGIVMMAGVLLLIVVVAAVRGRLVPGQASAQPSLPPPQVGDCVTENPNALGADLNTWSSVLPTVSTASCTGDRFGEVAACCRRIPPML